MSFCTRMPKENIFTKANAIGAFYLPRKSEFGARNDSIVVDNIPFVRRKHKMDTSIAVVSIVSPNGI